MSETPLAVPPPSSPPGRLRRYAQTAQHWLTTRVAALQRRRHSAWRRLAPFLEGIGAVLVLSGLSSLVAEYGFDLSATAVTVVHRWQTHLVRLFLAVFMIRLGLAPHPWMFLKQHPIQSLLMTLVALDLVASVGLVSPPWLDLLRHRLDLRRLVLVGLASTQSIILFTTLLGSVYYGRIMTTWQIRPAQTLVLSFLALIVLGALLLMLPRATHQPGPMPLLQALFTATSAVCVTGLIVVDTATTFTPLGQGIILGLCQLGGLGILTFATIIGMLVRGGPGIREKLVLHDFVRTRQFGEITVTIRRIVGLTLTIEALGALSLYLNWQTILPDTGTRLWHAVFHAVSAFCNAGFSTFSDNLAGPAMAMHAGTTLTIALLIVLGGLGFVVLWEGGQWLATARRGRRVRLSVQSRLVCLTAALLIVLGAVMFAVLETDGVLNGRPVGEQLLGALFQSVTARTAGFNTLAIDRLAISTTFLIMLLMLVGAAPGSTGGGLKITTVVVLLLTTVATIRNKARVELFHRTLPWAVINQAYATFFFAILVITLSLFVLCMTETHPFLDLFFEEISAFATVGLSRGITPTLSPAGQCIIMVSMFVGRVGSLTLGVALARQVSTTAYEYPAESVMVG